MKLIVKKLQGGECTIEVQLSTLISEVKEKVSEQLSIPVRQQTLLFCGRTLLDEQDVQSYPSIKDGSKLTLVVKKPDGLYDIAFKAFKKAGMTDTEAKCTTNKFLDTIQENFNKLSWDDIDTLALDCMEEATVKATS